MSFYGNSYYYTAESFARIILSNLGLLPEFKQEIPSAEDLTNDVYLDALRRESGLGISSGNHWIVLKPSDDDSFKIYHNAPIENDPEKYTIKGVTSAMVAKEGEYPNESDKITEIGFNECLVVPFI
jgi:hypothetical protein